MTVTAGYKKSKTPSNMAISDVSGEDLVLDTH